MPTQAVAPCSGDMRRSHMSRPSCVFSRHCSFALRSSRCSTSRHCAARRTQPQHPDAHACRVSPTLGSAAHW